MKRIVQEFFQFILPKWRPQDKLPRLPPEYVLPNEQPGEFDPKVSHLRAKAVARSERGARHLLNRHAGKKTARIARIERRTHKRKESTVRYAFRKFISLWRI